MGGGRDIEMFNVCVFLTSLCDFFVSLSFLLFTLRGRAGGDICGEPWLGIATASWKRENRSRIVTNIDYIVMGSLRDDIT